MHLSRSNRIVLVLTAPAERELAAIGAEVHLLPGVESVVACVDKRQLSVRFDPTLVSSAAIRACVWRRREPSGVPGALLTAWPRVADALPFAMSLL